MIRDNTLVALAGQPNCGKSTVFNALTGGNQHIANYPGITVEKRSGTVRTGRGRVELVDLPGTYSMTSFSLEERVARDFLLENRPAAVINVLDATNLKRSLNLTFQLMEMGLPVIVEANMLDVAERRGVHIDFGLLAGMLNLTVVPTAIKSGKGKRELMDALDRRLAGDASDGGANAAIVDYGNLEPFIGRLADTVEETLPSATYNRIRSRWLALTLLEEDPGALNLAGRATEGHARLRACAEACIAEYTQRYSEKPARHISNSRYGKAHEVASRCIRREAERQRPLSDRIDAVVCHRVLGPVILVAVVWMLYELSIVQGYHLTAYTWPLLLKIKQGVAALMPDPGFIETPMLRLLSLWVTDSVLALLNYIPIFLILFALIAILEDAGYMPRMAFILDKLFSRYGLHGQSTLPMVLGGIYAGGCAVPAILSTKGIPDERARMATILIIPMLNCLAKIPLYILLVNTYFPANKGTALFFISTVTLFIVLPVSRILTSTVLRNREEAPFVMEMPPYHLPSLKRVAVNALQKVWLYTRKIITVVASVSVILFVLIRFPGLEPERRAVYDDRALEIRTAFARVVEKSPYAGEFHMDETGRLVAFYENYRTARMGIGDPGKIRRIDERFRSRSPLYFSFIKPGGDRDAAKIRRALKKLVRQRRAIVADMNNEIMEKSFMGYAGKALEPLTQYAGFSWRINISLLSALAAKENTVATLGALFRQGDARSGVEAGMKSTETGFTPIHALALMLFMALYPPCIPAAVMVKVQTGSFRWMVFSLVFPALLGFAVAAAVFTGGTQFGLTGLQAMGLFYLFAVGLTLLTGTPAWDKAWWRAESGHLNAQDIAGR